MTGNQLDRKTVSTKWNNIQFKIAQKFSKLPDNGKCDFCSQTFPEKEELASHIKKCYKKLKQQCHLCTESFTNKAVFENHCIAIHGLTNMYQCKLCPREFPKRNRPFLALFFPEK